MKEENAIEVHNITKSFKIYLDKGHTMKERLLFRKRRAYEVRSVLNGISFEVKKGEAVGLIGHNGCGKSTTLKLLTKIMYPDSGSIEMRGRVSSLIELGAGFHPDMSGRENIYINASIFGLTRSEIDRRLEDIIAFSELEQFIDNPVRTYSSGMYMRLAFSVAINVDADILLIDEILAVGDVAFQAKCFNKLREIKGNGTTIVIVSHSLSQIEQICERSYWIDKGEIRMMGQPGKVHPEYMNYMGEQEKIQKEKIRKKNQSRNIDNSQNTDAQIQDAVEIISVSFTDKQGVEKTAMKCGEEIYLNIEYKLNSEEVEETLLGLLFFRNDGVVCYGTNTQKERMPNIKLNNEGKIVCHFSKMNLVAGEYYVDIAIRKINMLPYVYLKEAAHFKIYSDIDEVGVARLDHSWEIG